MAEIYNRTLVETKAAMLLIPHSARILAKNTPSRPGELHPEPLTDPDVNLSIHPARATQRRLPPSIKTRRSSGYPLSPSQCGWPAPFAPRELPRFVTTTEQSAPDRCLGIFGLMVVSICAFSLAITDPVLKFRTQA